MHQFIYASVAVKDFVVLGMFMQYLQRSSDGSAWNYKFRNMDKILILVVRVSSIVLVISLLVIYVFKRSLQ